LFDDLAIGLPFIASESLTAITDHRDFNAIPSCILLSESAIARNEARTINRRLTPPRSMLTDKNNDSFLGV